jgi:hypothetical protein
MSRLKFTFLLFGLLVGSCAFSNEIDSVYRDSIRNYEYQLEGLSHNIINSEDLQERTTSCFYFIQTLKKALMVPQSFDYEFTLLKTVSILKPEDEKFRIFTWNLLLDSGQFMYFGAIQMNNRDSLVLYGLYDSSEYVDQPIYDIVDNRHWIGSLYYQIHHYRHKRQDRYLLLGWDGEDSESNKKVIDILWFDEEEKPHFGLEVFDFESEIQSRVIFEFADRAVMLCRYEEDEDRIVFANLVPPNPLQKGLYHYYLPDGTYDVLKYEKGFWKRYQLLFGDSKNPYKYRDE